MKWVFYVIVFVYMFYRAVYGKKVIEPVPSLSVEPLKYGANHFLPVGNYVTVSCKGSNKNQKVEWLYPNHNAVSSLTSDRIYSQVHFTPAPRGRSPGLMLTITSAKVEDSGFYYCRSGDLIQNVSLCILDPVVFVEPETEITADWGRSVTLSCPAKGDPEPLYVWTRNGKPITDEDGSTKYRLMTKYNTEDYQGLLTIMSLEPEDSGVYSCATTQGTPKNDECVHSNMLNITLNVRHPPIFDDNDTMVYVQSNQAVELKCSANAFPEATYKWLREMKDTRQILSEGKIELSDDKNQTVLAVNPGSTFGQKYVCQASNGFGFTEKYFTLAKMTKPIQPIEVTFINATDNTIEFNVKWDTETLFPIDSFDIQYLRYQQRPSGRNISLQETAWKRSIHTEHVLEDAVTDLESGVVVTLDSLEEETKYWVRVRAVNSAGESPWSEPVLVATARKVELTTTEVPIDVLEELEDPEELENAELSDSTFYGIFFAGGILVVAFVCMFAMRLVK